MPLSLGFATMGTGELLVHSDAALVTLGGSLVWLLMSGRMEHRLGKVGALCVADGGDLQGKWAGAEFLFMAFDVLIEGFQLFGVELGSVLAFFGRGDIGVGSRL